MASREGRWRLGTRVAGGCGGYAGTRDWWKRSPVGAQERKNIMGWKLTFALMLFSVAVVSALTSGGEPENEAVVRDEAAKQLSALRKHLIRR